MQVSGAINFNEPDPLKSTIPLRGDTGKLATADKLTGISIATDVSVWSGTNFNVKDNSGDAVKLFSRGLNYAGVRNLILSLWTPPGDRASELLDFYRNKQAGMSPAEALRKAELQAISRDQAPHAWAAYQMVGIGH